MTVTLPDVLRHIHHYYAAPPVIRQWRTVGGTLYPTDILAPGSWVAICERGPIGVYQIDEGGCIPVPDRQWTGPIHPLDIPADLLHLCGEIADWAAAHESDVTQEKFGAYSVTRRGGDWQSAFSAALNPYRRMYPEVKV